MIVYVYGIDCLNCSVSNSAVVIHCINKTLSIGDCPFCVAVCTSDYLLSWWFVTARS